MIENDTWYKCTICGREGTVGRCCGDDTRIPLNDLAKKEQRQTRSHLKQFKELYNSIGIGVYEEIWKDRIELIVMSEGRSEYCISFTLSGEFVEHKLYT